MVERAHSHPETHLKGFALPEVILGGQDGLVNVLGIILGVAAATADAHIVIVAGLAATFAESVAMAGVAYTSKIAEADFYESELEREKREIEQMPEAEREEVRVIYRKFGFTGAELEDVVKKITSDKKVWLDVMMSQELKLELIGRSIALKDGVIVGISALIGSIIPLAPFFFFPVATSISISLFTSALALFAVGYYKAKVTLGRSLVKQGLEMLAIGMLSALVGYIIGTFFRV